MARFGVPIRIEEAAILWWDFFQFIGGFMRHPVLSCSSPLDIHLWFWDVDRVMGLV